MEPYRDTPDWATFVESCPELALPDHSDEEDWRAGLAKVKAQPDVQRQDTPLAENSTVPTARAVSEVPAAPSSPVVAQAPVSGVPANTQHVGPAPRPRATLPVVRAPSLPTVVTMGGSLTATPRGVPANASVAPASDASDDEDEDEAEPDESDEDEIVDLPEDPEAVAEADADEGDAGPPSQRRSHAKRPTRGARQLAKEFPSEVRPEDLPLGAYRAGPDLVVRPMLPLSNLR